MKTHLIAACAALNATLAVAQEVTSVDAAPTGVEAWQADPTVILDAAEVDIDAFKWIARPVVVFADTPADPSFTQQVDNIEDRIGELARRDVAVITDADPSAQSDLRQRLRPRGFMLVLMGKDGAVKLRKPLPWDVREITRSIDKTPERQQELRERRDDGSRPPG